MSFTKIKNALFYYYNMLRTTYYCFYCYIILTKMVLGDPKTRPPQLFKYKTEQNKYI